MLQNDSYISDWTNFLYIKDVHKGVERFEKLMEKSIPCHSAVSMYLNGITVQVLCIYYHVQYVHQLPLQRV